MVSDRGRIAASIQEQGRNVQGPPQLTSARRVAQDPNPKTQLGGEEPFYQLLISMVPSMVAR